jgi:hypothetical protein
MIVSYHGLESFKVSQGDLVLALNPVSKESKLKSVNYGADITLVSINHQDMNGVGQTARGEKNPFVINGPGEYEVKGVVIKGLISESNYNGSPRVNTIFYITLEGMNLCYLGALSTNELSADTLEAIEEVDILFVPIGGDGVLSPAEAYKLAVSLEPKIIIPMHYSVSGGTDSESKLKQFAKEGGLEKISQLDKLVLKKKDLEDKKGEIVVLKEE